MGNRPQRAFAVASALSAGVLLTGAPAAATEWTATGNSGLVNGNQIDARVQAPLNLCGNAIGLLGSASADCTGGAMASFGSGKGGRGGSSWNTSSNSVLGNGNQIAGVAQVPINFCGNAIGLLGDAVASCHGGAMVGHGHKHKMPHPHHHDPYDRYPTPGPHNQIAPAATGQPGQLGQPARLQPAPLAALTELLSLDGLTGLLGLGSKGFAAPQHQPAGGHHTGYGDKGKTCAVDMTSTGNTGLVNGVQVNAPIQAPINFSGNAIGLLGDASASAMSQASAHLSC